MIRLFQFFGLGLLLLMALNGLSWVLDDGSWDQSMRARLSAIQGHEAVTLGGSVGVGVRYPHMCVDGADYYWSNQDLFEVTAVADLILEGPSPPRYWFVVAAPTAQAYDNGASASELGAHRRQIHRLMFRHGRFDMVGGDWRQVLVTALTPALGYDAWGSRFHLLLRRILLTPSPTPDPSIYRAERDLIKLDPAVAASEAEAFMEGRSAHFDRMAYYDASISRRSEAALLSMHRRIRARGGTMILVVPPMTEAVRTPTERLLRRQVREFEAMTRRLGAQGVVVSDHWRDPAFGQRYDLFADIIHLNGAGAEAFSRSLASQLRSQGVLPATTCGAAQGAGKPSFPATPGDEIVNDVRVRLPLGEFNE